MTYARDETEKTPLLTDSVYRVLGNRRRRHVLFVLARGDDPMDIGTLAERIAALEYDLPAEEITYAQRKSVYTGLYQNHLPTMQQAGLVSAEEGWGRIDLTDEGRGTANLLDGTASTSGRERRYSFGLLTFGIGLLVGALFPLSPSVGVPGVGFPVLIATMLAAVVVGYAFTV